MCSSVHITAKYLTIFLCFGVFLLARPTQAQSVPFTNLDLRSVRTMAEQQDKLFFLYFSADWCMPCRWMAEHTFTDPRVVDYVKMHYLPVLVDVDQRNRQHLQEQFSVKMLPTLLFFSTEGKLIGRVETAIGPTALLDSLRRLNVAANHRLPVQAASRIAEQHLAVAPQPIIHFTAPSLERDAVPINSRPLITNHNTQLNSRSGEVYTIVTKQVSDLLTAQQEAAAIDLKYGYPSSIRAVQHTGQLAYQVIVGRFNLRSEAREFLTYLNRNDIIGEIVSLPAESE